MVTALAIVTKIRRLDVNRLTAIANLASQVDALEGLHLAQTISTTTVLGRRDGLSLPFSRLAPGRRRVCSREFWLEECIPSAGFTIYIASKTIL